MAHERPARTVAEWLGIDATLTAPWSDDRPRIVDRDELAAMIERPPARAARGAAGRRLRERRPTAARGSCRARRCSTSRCSSTTPASTSSSAAKLRDLLRRRLAKAVDDAVKLIVERTGAGFAGDATPDELATALGALRPIARETTSLILAQEVERALARPRRRRSRCARTRDCRPAKGAVVKDGRTPRP